MRTIKFRGQDQSGNWVFGYLVRKPYAEFSIIDKDGNEHSNVVPESIAQFIGRDKNGKEIYECDQVSYGYNDKTYTSTITLHPHTWSGDVEKVRTKDEEFLLSRYALVE